MKPKTMFCLPATFFLTGALWASATVLGAADFDHNLEKTFEVSPGGKLVLQVDQGACEITPVQTDKVQVRVLRQVKGGTKAQADELFSNHEVTFQQAGGTVSVLAKTKRNLSLSGRPNQPYLRVRYEIRVPKKLESLWKTTERGSE
jgi:hypothetical protein